MKRKIYKMLLLLLHTSCFGQSLQCHYLDSLYLHFTGNTEHNFQIKKSQNRVNFYKLEKTEYKKLISGLRGSQFTDSLWITVQCDTFWTELFYDSVKAQNIRILDSISPIFLRKADSIKWRGMKTNLSEFNSNRAQVILDYQYFLAFDHETRLFLKDLVKLPHHRVGNCGFFFSYFPGIFLYIVDDVAREKFYYLVNSVKSFLGISSVVNIDVYE